MRNKLHVVGVGPGDSQYILPAAQRIIEESDVIIGGRRNLSYFSQLGKEEVVIGNNLEEICEYIRGNNHHKRIVVLASGDPGIFSITEVLKKQLEFLELEVIPGISSFQYLCSKLQLGWHDVRILSLHGRKQDDWLNIINTSHKVVVFTGGTSSPQGICKDMIQAGLKDLIVTVGENLSYPNERIVTGSPAEIAKDSFEHLAILMVQNQNLHKLASEIPQKISGDVSEKIWEYTTSGIPDNMFIRGDVPMTKEEVRAVTLGKLRIRESDIIYDIGAGTGSVSIECGFRCSSGTVYAIEKENDALELIKKNIEKFQLQNIKVIEGKAPEVLKALPVPDRVFIGGSGGKIEDILKWLKDLEKPVRVVANAVSVESAYEIIHGFQEKTFTGIDISMISVSRSRKAGTKHLMQALNPIYVVSADYGGKQ